MHVLILGANSDIAYAVAKMYAASEKASIHLASRNMEQLEKKKQDLTTRYKVDVSTYAFDAENFDSHADFIESLTHKPDVVIVSFGSMVEQKISENDFSDALKCINSNYIGVVSILEHIAREMESDKAGCIIGISSVAGERGRQSNYIYGSAKAGLTAYLSGLRNRLYKSNVNVITVLPGFVKTKMTDGMDLPDKLTAEPDKVAEDIYKAYKKNKPVIYTLWVWRYIMIIIRSIPEKIFVKLNL